MSKDNVINFPGLTTLKIDPDKVIEAARGKLETVVIVGYDKDGFEYFASSDPNGPEILWLLERAKTGLINAVSATEEEYPH
jgi:hypothetical protein